MPLTLYNVRLSEESVLFTDIPAQAGPFAAEKAWAGMTARIVSL